MATHPDVDYLDIDPRIPGQTYVAMSFLSPEDVIVQKDTYVFSEYIKNFSVQVLNMFEGLKKAYPDKLTDIEYIMRNNEHFLTQDGLHEDFVTWRRIHESDLDAKFKDSSDFVTTTRGVKCRGVFSSQQEVVAHIEKLKKLDKYHDIFVTEVGAWAPWDPSALDHNSNVEYREKELNTLAGKYKELRDQQLQKTDEERKNVRNKLSELMPSLDTTPIQIMKDAMLVGEEKLNKMIEEKTGPSLSEDA